MYKTIKIKQPILIYKKDGTIIETYKFIYKKIKVLKIKADKYNNIISYN